MWSRLAARWPLVIAGVFCLYSLLLIGMALRDRGQLRAAAETRLIGDSQRRAGVLGEFLRDRIHLTEDLTELNEVNTYLVSKALGMSPLYGLGVSLEALELRLRARIKAQRSDDHSNMHSSFARLLMLDEAGQPLADSGGPALPPQPAGGSLQPSLALDLERRLLVASVPILFKDRFSGTMVSMTDVGEVFHSIVQAQAEGGYREILLTREGREIEAPGQPAVLTPALAVQLARLTDGRAVALATLMEDAGVSALTGDAVTVALADGFAILAPVPETPFLLVMAVPRDALEGGLAPASYLVSMGALPLILLFLALRFTRLQERARALARDAARASAQQQALEDRNESLSVEIRRREVVEAELQAHRDHLEELVDRRSAELHRLFSALPDLYFRALRDGSILECLAGEQSDLLIPTAQMIGQRMQDIVPPGVATKLVAALGDIALGADQSVVEYSLALQRGIQFFEARLLPLGHDQLVMVVRNVTDRRGIEDAREANRRETERLARVKSEFLTNMSHEIRTPLNAVLGLAQVGARSAGDSSARASFKPIEEAGRHLLAIVDDILDFSKLEAGKLAIERQVFQLADAVQGAVSLVVGRTQAKGLDLQVDRAPGLPEWVEGDALRLKQVLLNLLANAVKFTERGRVALTITQDGDRFEFRISDTGIGITEAQLTQLFKPFEQADGSTTRRFGGTGLGLAISHDLANLMGGELVAESRPGEGSVFTLRLPLPVRAPPVAAPPAEAGAGAGQRLRGLCLLAAEDNDVNRLVLQAQLEHEGAQVVFTTNGLEAVGAVEQDGPRAYQAVLMDVQMPVMDGLEATRRIHLLAPTLPVIGLTAHAMVEERDRCLAAGMVVHVAKPVDIDVLVAELLRHAERVPRP